jgi:hypothetical protein
MGGGISGGFCSAHYYYSFLHIGTQNIEDNILVVNSEQVHF